MTCSECGAELGRDGTVHAHFSTCSRAKRDPLTGRAIPKLSELRDLPAGMPPPDDPFERKDWG